jgi:hypothetical protein
MEIISHSPKIIVSCYPWLRKISSCVGASFKPHSQVTMTRNCKAKPFLINFLSRRKPIWSLVPLPSTLNLHMTTTMTLRLAEKALVQSFGTSKVLARTGSTVLILFHNQRLRSTLGIHASGVSTFLACLLLEHFYPEFMICSIGVLP